MSSVRGPVGARGRVGVRYRQQLALDVPQGREAGLPVVAVQLAEVVLEARIGDQRGQRGRVDVVEPERVSVTQEPVQ